MHTSIPLPPSSHLQLPALLSLFKKKTTVPVQSRLVRTFQGVEIDDKQLQAYRQLFDFQNPRPTTYLYLPAQRAQLALMIEKAFPVPVPGLIHLENELLVGPNFQFDRPFDLVAEAKLEYKNSGTIIARFLVSFLQDHQVAATCKSTYLKRSKTKPHSNHPIPIELTPQKATYSEPWLCNNTMKAARTYAQLSGDRNPIHVSKMLARLFGFRKPILHGWYTASQIAQQYERLTDSPCQYYHIQFEKPIYWNSEQILWVRQAPDCWSFQLKADLNNQCLVKGRINHTEQPPSQADFYFID